MQQPGNELPPLWDAGPDVGTKATIQAYNASKTPGLMHAFDLWFWLSVVEDPVRQLVKIQVVGFLPVMQSWLGYSAFVQCHSHWRHVGIELAVESLVCLSLYVCLTSRQKNNNKEKLRKSGLNIWRLTINNDKTIGTRKLLAWIWHSSMFLSVQVFPLQYLTLCIYSSF